ncbi:MAG TPA: CPXCG motif-containing cysteine-rich protein [Tepidisphaeraceae bacterium]|nr:CPXCG motif-containing cysteine-rich protein [Tepidisphaeraceae bacterium]
MKKKRRRARSADEGRYTCPTCGETIVIPLDFSQGTTQTYVEDCPVCCNPNTVHVETDPDWNEPRVWADPE